jgi:hypothetical protein
VPVELAQQGLAGAAQGRVSLAGLVQTFVKISIRGALSTPAACIPARSAGAWAKLPACSAVGNSCVRNRSWPPSGRRITRCAVQPGQARPASRSPVRLPPPRPQLESGSRSCYLGIT